MPGFNVSIIAGKDKASSSAHVQGSVQHVITDDERKTFGLSDSALKKACDTYFGKQPDDVFLHSPTPWGDLYKLYNWEQTQTVLVATSAEILDITSEPVSLKTQIFQNDSTHEADFDVSISDSVSDSVTSSWNTGGTLSVGQMIKYEVGFLGTGGGGETSLSYSQSWGVGGTKTKTVTVGSRSSVKVSLKPNEGVVATLSASRGVMKVRIRFEAYLTGTTAVNYDHGYRGHHYWDFWTGAVMSTSDIPNRVESTEDIEIGYYSNGKIEIRDTESNALVSSHFL